jgi:hypothetical protein
LLFSFFLSTMPIKSLWVCFFGFFIGNDMSLDYAIAMIIFFVSLSHFVWFSLDHRNHQSMIQIFSQSFYEYCCCVFSLWELRVIRFAILSDTICLFACSLSLPSSIPLVQYRDHIWVYRLNEPRLLRPTTSGPLVMKRAANRMGDHIQRFPTNGVVISPDRDWSNASDLQPRFPNPDQMFGLLTAGLWLPFDGRLRWLADEAVIKISSIYDLLNATWTRLAWHLETLWNADMIKIILFFWDSARLTRNGRAEKSQ